jgi:hypothetical protein
MDALPLLTVKYPFPLRIISNNKPYFIGITEILKSSVDNTVGC